MQAPDFIKGQAAEPVTQDTLARLSGMVAALVEVDSEIEDLELQLAVKKQERAALGGDRIPSMLSQHGLSELRLSDGRKVKIKEDLSVSVPDDKRAAFFTYLRATESEDIIKTTARFPRMEQEKLEELRGLLGQYDAEINQEVHPQTQKKFFRDLLGVGDPDRDEGIGSGKYLRKEDPLVQAMANIFVFFTTKIEEPKSR